MGHGCWWGRVGLGYGEGYVGSHLHLRIKVDSICQSRTFEGAFLQYRCSTFQIRKSTQSLLLEHVLILVFSMPCVLHVGVIMTSMRHTRR